MSVAVVVVVVVVRLIILSQGDDRFNRISRF